MESIPWLLPAENVSQPPSSSFLLLSSLELGDSNVYEPSVRARLRTTAHFCEVAGLKLPPMRLTYAGFHLCALPMHLKSE